MKKIEIDVITLITLLLIICSIVVGTIAYYHYSEDECIKNPVDYANNYSYNYWWDNVFPIKW